MTEGPSAKRSGFSSETFRVTPLGLFRCSGRRRRVERVRRALVNNRRVESLLKVLNDVRDRVTFRTRQRRFLFSFPLSFEYPYSPFRGHEGCERGWDMSRARSENATAAQPLNFSNDDRSILPPLRSRLRRAYRCFAESKGKRQRQRTSPFYSPRYFALTIRGSVLNV